MKLAICLPGFIRTWEKSKPSFLKNLVQNHDCDLFVHTYNQNYFEYSSNKKDVLYTDNEIISMFDGFNLRKIEIEDREEIRESLERESEKYKDIRNYSINIKESSGGKDNYINLGIRIYDQLRKIYLVNKLRKEYQEKTLLESLNILESKVKFVRAVVNDELVVFKRK